MDSNLRVPRTELIAEIGLSHEGSLGRALSMITECKESGMDYVKFQFHSSYHESTKNEAFRVNVFPQDITRRDYWDRTSFSIEDWKRIIDHCKETKIKFLCTPFSTYAARILLNFGIQEIKVGSGDAMNFEILEFAKENFRRIFLSTGLCSVKEILKVRDFFRDYSGDLVLMQCTSEYPSRTSEVGLSFIKSIREMGLDTGLSDHTGNLHVAMSAIAYGVSFLEFHIVYSRKEFGPDSLSSLTFEEAIEISKFRETWHTTTDPNYEKDKVSSRLNLTKEKFGRGLALVRPVKKGEVLTRDMLTMKKPQGPLSWEDLHFIQGKRARQDLSVDVHLKLTDVE